MRIKNVYVFNYNKLNDFFLLKFKQIKGSFYINSKNRKSQS